MRFGIKSQSTLALCLQQKKQPRFVLSCVSFLSPNNQGIHGISTEQGHGLIKTSNAVIRLFGKNLSSRRKSSLSNVKSALFFFFISVPSSSRTCQWACSELNPNPYWHQLGIISSFLESGLVRALIKCTVHPTPPKIYVKTGSTTRCRPVMDIFVWKSQLFTSSWYEYSFRFATVIKMIIFLYYITSVTGQHTEAPLRGSFLLRLTVVIETAHMKFLFLQTAFWGDNKSSYSKHIKAQIAQTDRK